MNPSFRMLASALLALLLATGAAWAGPGAHGPNGEHLDAPVAVRTGPALPRTEAHTETFELVAELREAELVIVVDRYDSNEPVLGARLELESGSLKAVSTFRAAQGDYVVTDPALLKALAAPGEHPLVFTLVAGPESDLLDATLVKAPAAAAGDDHGHDHEGPDQGLARAAWAGIGLAAVVLLASAVWWRRRRHGARLLQGGL